MLSVDWASFDKRVSVAEFQAAFDVLEELADFPDSNTRIIFKLVRYAFIYSRIALPNSDLLVLRGIIPAGSFLTAILDTIVNLNRLHHLFNSYNIED